MGFVFRLEDYARYLERVGAAACVDVTRRTDPARIQRVWENLGAVIDAHGAPWIVQLWTKDAAGTLERGGALLRRLRRHGTTLATQVTVTGLGGTMWEPCAPAEPFSGVSELIGLAGGPEHVKWRYDPLIPTVHDIGRFRILAARAGDLGISHCVINTISPSGRYKRVDARLASVLPGWVEEMPGFDDAWRIETIGELVQVASEYGLEVAACAESTQLSGQIAGLLPAVCGDHDWFVALSGRDPGRAVTTGSRPACSCAAYFDVGLYGQRRRCHQCLYCYAG